MSIDPTLRQRHQGCSRIPSYFAARQPVAWCRVFRVSSSPRTQAWARLFEGRIIILLRRGVSLAPDPVPAQVRIMFTVSESEAEAIRRAYEAGGELSAVVELRRYFPGITDNENARRCARMIAGWTPRPPRPRTQGRRRYPTKS